MGEFLQNISNLLIALQVLLTVVIAAGAWSMRKAFVTRKEFEESADDIGKRLTMHSERLLIGDARFTRIEDRFGTLPTAPEVTDLKVAIERLGGEVRRLEQRLEGFDDLQEMLRSQVDRMDEFLRKQA